MRTLNFRLAAICLVAVVVLAVGVHFLHGFQVGRNRALAFKLASQRAEAERNINEAIHHLVSYLELVPADHKEQLHLGLLYAERLNAPAAFAKLEEVVRTDDGTLSPEDLRNARRKLVDMAMMIRDANGRLRAADAETHLAVLLKETPNDPELLDLNGQILIYNGKDELACEQFRKAIEVAPAQINSYVFLAIVLRSRLDRKAEADKVMEDMIHHKVKVKDKDGNVVKNKDGKDVEVEVNAKSVAAFQKYAYYLREQERFDETLLQVQRILELVPENSAGLLIAGHCYLAKGQYKTAEDYLNRGIQADKHNRAMYKVMVDVKNHLGLRDESAAVLRLGLANTKGTDGYVDILWDVVNSNIVAGKFDEAEKNIKELRELRVGPEGRTRPQLVEFVEARLAVMKGDWKAAKKILKEVLPKLQDDPGVQKLAYLHLGQCDHQEGLVEEQIVAYSEALKIDPYLVPARVGLADIFMSRGNLAEAADQYRILANAPHPDPEAALSMARITIMLRLTGAQEAKCPA